MTVAGTGVRDDVDREKEKSMPVVKYANMTTVEAIWSGQKQMRLSMWANMTPSDAARTFATTARESERQQRARWAVVAMWTLKRIDHIYQ